MSIIGQDNSFVKAFLIVIAISAFILLCSIMLHLLCKKSRNINSNSWWYVFKCALLTVGVSFTITSLLILSVGIQDKVQIVKVSDKAYIEEVIHPEYNAKIIEMKDDYIVVSISESEIKDIEKQVALKQLLNKTKE